MENNNNADHGNDRKMFTQAEVDEIISKRLERERKKYESAPDPDEIEKKSADLTAKEKELAARELRLDCKNYLSDNGMSADLIDIISAGTLDEFKEKADKVTSITGTRRPAQPLFNAEAPQGDADKLAEAFGRGNKHKPKENY